MTDTESQKMFTLRVRIPTDADDVLVQAQQLQATRAAYVEAAQHATRITSLSQEIVDEVMVGIDGKEFTNRIIMTTAECEVVTTFGVMADTFEGAMKLVRKTWPGVDWKNSHVVVIAERMHLARLYGYRSMPLVVDPKIKVLLWHRDIEQHVRAGRIVVI